MNRSSLPARAGGALAILVTFCQAVRAADMTVVPLFDGERSDTRNLWGGPFNSGNISNVTRQSAVVHSGMGAFRANLGFIPNDGFRFFQTFSSAVDNRPGYRQDRDLTQYDYLEGYVRNDSGVPLTFSLELKDYRDSNANVAKRSYTLPAGVWTRIEAPLDLGAGWSVTGSPDLQRTFAVGFLVDADFGAANGSLYLDDFRLKERGPSIDAAAAPLEAVVERLARRQFLGLWSARHKSSGLIPNSSDNVAIGALNATTGVVWTLPSAVRRGWVTQAEADAYMGQLVTTLNSNRDQTSFLPTRFLDFNTGAPVTDREESTIDAAFIALALHQYKSQPTTPVPLRDAIDGLQNRFNFQAFVRAAGYNAAYFPDNGFAGFSYTGYTNENKVITLAGEVSDAFHVPLESMWNKDTGRVLDHLVNPDENFLTYSYGTEFRAPFTQALLNLFVDTSDRGVDNYFDRTLARNPNVNFVRYQNEVSAKLAQLNRDHFVQPDAGRGPTSYEAFSLFNNYGQPDLFMPWSVAFALLAGAENSEDALRFLLDNGLGTGLDGPLGLADSAVWATGAADPSYVTSYTDNWNMALSTMALLKWLDGDLSGSHFFASLPEVDAALDEVFLDGDLDGNGVTNAADLAIWRAGYGDVAGATPAGGDADGNGTVDGADFLRWQRGVGRTTAGAGGSTGIPEPSAAMTFVIGLTSTAIAMRGRIRRRFLDVDEIPERAIESACISY